MPSSLPAQAQQPTSAHTAGRLTADYEPANDRHILNSPTGPIGHFCGWSSDGVTTEDEDQANAARLALAWNSHDELLAVAERLAEWEQDPDRFAGDLADLAQQARTLLAKLTQPTT